MARDQPSLGWAVLFRPRIAIWGTGNRRLRYLPPTRLFDHQMPALAAVWFPWHLQGPIPPKDSVRPSAPSAAPPQFDPSPQRADRRHDANKANKLPALLVLVLRPLTAIRQPAPAFHIRAAARNGNGCCRLSWRRRELREASSGLRLQRCPREARSFAVAAARCSSAAVEWGYQSELRVHQCCLALVLQK